MPNMRKVRNATEKYQLPTVPWYCCCRTGKHLGSE